MFTRKRCEITPEAAKRHLKEYGWSYRAAAPRLGVTYVHLSQVLNQHRQSRRLLRAISKLPHRKEEAA